jgi:hypothetical protein
MKNMLTLCLLLVMTAIPAASVLAADSTAQTVPVKIVKTAEGYSLMRGGKPFFVKGAGGSGSAKLLAACGANSLRTWGADTLDDDLKRAASAGITVCAGIWLGHKEQGFRYDDPTTVQKQLDDAKSVIETHKNASNLLIWAIGNEMEGYGQTTDPAMWKSVEDIAKAAHTIDPNHPTMTVVAEIGADKIEQINKYCPDIDIIGINSYGEAATVGARYRSQGGAKPYILSEFGPAGVWETAKNAWGAAPEQTSTQKGAVYAEIYKDAVASQPNCLGSYAFYWGTKQEATPTWFGILLPDGSRLEAADELGKAWTGKIPVYPVPVINSIELDGLNRVDAGAHITAKLSITVKRGEKAFVTWKLLSDPLDYSPDAASPQMPIEFPEVIAPTSDAKHADVVMPKYRGAYRLYAYIRDEHGGAAVGNIPIEVTTGENTPPPQGNPH